MQKLIRMSRRAVVTIGLLALTHLVFATELSDDWIRGILINESRMNYPGNCPCPDNLDRAGRRCGKRSAYSKPGGYAPLCYPVDVTREMIERFKRERRSDHK